MFRGFIEKKAEAEILKGRSRQEIFNEIVSQTQLDIHKVANVLRKIPTAEKRKKFNSLNLILALGIALNIVANIFVSETVYHNHSGIFSSLLGVLLLFGIIKYRPGVHLAVGIILTPAALFVVLQEMSNFNIFSLFDIGIAISLAIIAFYLNKELVCDYELNKEILKTHPEQRVDAIRFIEK